jgi:hypothetical protein
MTEFVSNSPYNSGIFGDFFTNWYIRALEERGIITKTVDEWDDIDKEILQRYNQDLSGKVIKHKTSNSVSNYMHNLTENHPNLKKGAKVITIAGVAAGIILAAIASSGCINYEEDFGGEIMTEVEKKSAGNCNDNDSEYLSFKVDLDSKYRSQHNDDTLRFHIHTDVEGDYSFFELEQKLEEDGYIKGTYDNSTDEPFDVIEVEKVRDKLSQEQHEEERIRKRNAIAMIVIGGIAGVGSIYLTYKGTKYIVNHIQQEIKETKSENLMDRIKKTIESAEKELKKRNSQGYVPEVNEPDHDCNLANYEKAAELKERGLEEMSQPKPWELDANEPKPWEKEADQKNKRFGFRKEKLNAPKKRSWFRNKKH